MENKRAAERQRGEAGAEQAQGGSGSPARTNDNGCHAGWRGQYPQKRERRHKAQELGGVNRDAEDSQNREQNEIDGNSRKKTHGVTLRQR